MSSVKFSDDQLSVIENKNGSVLVSAAAGSGKSTVLVERIIRTVCEDGADIDKLLVVTFTKAAASGMKEKISKALRKKIAENPTDTNLKKQLLLLNACNISTVHSFCTKILEKYGYFLPENIPSNYSIIDETENALMKQEVLNELIDELYESDDEDFIALVERYAPGRSDESLNTLIFGIYGKMTSSPFYFRWLDKAAELLKNSGDFENSMYAEVICEHISKIINAHLEKYEFALSYIQTTDGLEKYEDVFKSEYMELKEIAGLKTFNEFKKAIVKLNCSFVRLPAAKRGTDNFPAKSVREALKDEISKLCSVFFEREDNAAETEAEECYPVVSKLFSVIMDFDTRYKEKKYSANYLDFNDLEQLTLTLLCENENTEIPSNAAKEIKNSFHEILVDEYQDTNEIQEAIFNLVSNNGNNLVMVGDVKQSIYRFRHANPELFLNRRNAYETVSGGTNISLNRNYRSRKSVLDFVNCIFDCAMTDENCGITYKNTERLKYFEGNYTEDTENKFNSEIILAVSENEEEISAELPEVLEARAVAKRINEIVSDENFRIRGEGGDLRCAEYRDTVILVRSFNSKTLIFLEELKKCGIPVTYDEKKSFFETPEIRIMISLLRAVDNPYDDISILSVLKHIFGFRNEEFLVMRKENKDLSFYEILLKKSNEPRVKKILCYLDELRDCTVRFELYKLIEKIYKDTYFKELQLGYVNGEQKSENLKLLTQIAKNFETTGYKGISAFISYVNKIIESKRAISAAVLGDGSRNTVEVMTIHKSKGLEFPVVVLAGCNRKFNQQDVRDRVLVDSKLGIGCDCFDIESRYKYPTIIKNILKKKEQTDNLCEELRILYVALTRAKEKLIVSGSAPKLNKDMERYAGMSFNMKNEITFCDFLKASCYFDFILPAVMRHEKAVKVFPLNYHGVEGYDFDIDIDVVVPEEIPFAEAFEAAESILDNASVSEAFVEKINRYTEFKYSAELTDIPQKISVSDARKLFDVEADNNVLRKNIVLNDIRASGGKIKNSAMTGTLLHYVFEKIDFNRIKEDGAYRAIKEFYDETPYINENLAFSEVEKTVRFFESETGKQLLGAEEIKREKDFLITVPAKSLYNGVNSGKKIIVQGVIDCYFRYGNKFTLIDYKYTGKSSEYLAETYKSQLYLYEEALRKIHNNAEICSCIWNINKCELIEIPTKG